MCRSPAPVILSAQPISASELALLRQKYRQTTPGQIVHDSLHRREGWTLSHRLRYGGEVAGYASMAVAGPWAAQPTVFELHIEPQHRSHAFALFEGYMAASGVRHFEVQTNDTLLTVMLHTYGSGVVSDKIVFEDKLSTQLPSNGARLVRLSAEIADKTCIAERMGGSEWRLESEGAVVATGGIKFHYNSPFCDVYMVVPGGCRRRGWGSYFVQEMKRVAYEMGQVPCARCNTANEASRRTLQRAGFVPCGLILLGTRP